MYILSSNKSLPACSQFSKIPQCWKELDEQPLEPARGGSSVVGPLRWGSFREFIQGEGCLGRSVLANSKQALISHFLALRSNRAIVLPWLPGWRTCI